MNPFGHLLRLATTDPDTTARIRRVLAAGVVLDTWITGEAEERVSPAADARLVEAEDRLVARAETDAPGCPDAVVSVACLRAACHELLFATALYTAQQCRGRRHVDLAQVNTAVDRVERVLAQAEGGQDLAVFFVTLAAHEDLNAIAYYGRMAEDDFVLGRLHRPGFRHVLTEPLAAYRRMGLVERVFTGAGDQIALTAQGHAILDQLRQVLESSGELAWRANQQRWVIFGELDYDAVVQQVAPDGNAETAAYLHRLGIERGGRVLEVGCGTGRATVDLGLCDLVGSDGQLVALDPVRPFLDAVMAKCRARGLTHVQTVVGRVEALPFPDGIFDATVAVGALQFTDIDRAVAEMARVTKPGGLVSALCPPGALDVRAIPMVALWFRPLSELADRWGIPLVDAHRVGPDTILETFRRHLQTVTHRPVPATISATDVSSFLAFMLKGAFETVLGRLPYQERGAIIRRLEVTGAELARETRPAEQQATFYGAAVYGRVP